MFVGPRKIGSYQLESRVLVVFGTVWYPKRCEMTGMIRLVTGHDTPEDVYACSIQAVVRDKQCPFEAEKSCRLRFTVVNGPGLSPQRIVHCHYKSFVKYNMR